MPVRKKAPDTNTLELFPELPVPTPEEVERQLKFCGNAFPVWTRQKANLGRCGNYSLIAGWTGFNCKVQP